MNEANKSVGRTGHQPNCDEEAAEVLRMKDECDRMAHELIKQIDALLARIEYILSRDREINEIGCGRNLSIEDCEFLIHGNQKLEA